MTGQPSLDPSVPNAASQGPALKTPLAPERPRSSRVTCPKSAAGYHAFISYSHAEDQELAPALQSALQRFAKPLLCRRALRIFRDKSSLSLTPELWPDIQRALGDSQYFLLLASPRAAQSPWVPREIAWWLQNKPPKTLLLVQTAGKDLDWIDERGDFNWEDVDALPKNLIGTFAYSPLRLDLRWTKGAGVAAAVKDPRFQDAVATIAATLHAIPKDELIGQDLDQHRRTLRITKIVAAVLTALLVLVALSGANWFIALDQARRSNSQLFAAQADTVYQQDNNVEQAALLARAAFNSADTPFARGALLQSIADGPKYTLSRIDSVDDPETPAPFVRDVAFSTSGGSVASLDGHGGLRLWHLDAIRAPSLLAHENMGGEFSTVAFAPNGSTILIAGSRGAMQCNAPSLGECVAVTTSDVESIAFHPGGEYLILGRPMGEVMRWKPGAASTETLLGPSNSSRVNVVAVASNGRIAAGYSDGAVTLWSEDGDQSWPVLTPASLGDEEKSEQPDWPAIKSLAFDPAGTVLVAGDTNGGVVDWDLSAPVPVGRTLFQERNRAILGLVFNAAGSALAVSDESPQTVIWDMARRVRIVTVDHGFLRITSAAVSPDFSRIVIGDQSNGTRIWSTVGPPLALFPPPNIGLGEITSVAFEPRSRRFAVGGADRSVTICELSQGNLTCSGEFDTASPVKTLAYSAGGDWLAIGEESGAITIWRRDGEPRSISVPAGFHAESLAIDDANGLLAAGGTIVDPTGLSGAPQSFIITASLETGQPLDHEPGLLAVPIVGLSSACPILVTEINNQTRAWPTPNGMLDRDNSKLVESIPAFSHSLAFSPDGTRLASGRENGSIVVWDVDCDVMPPLLRDNLDGRSSDQPAQHIAFSPDARYLVSGHTDGVVALWDVENGESLGLVARLQDPIVGVKWTDELSIVAVDALGAVVELEGNPAEWKSTACQVAGRDFTAAEASRFVGAPSHRVCQDATGIFGLPNLEEWVRSL